MKMRKMKTSKVNALDMIEKLRGKVEEVHEDNEWLLFHGRRGKWNVKIYRNKKDEYRVVTNDEVTLQRILDDQETDISKERTIQVDDAGVGSPIGGVLIGACDSKTKEFVFDEIPVEFFQGEKFARQEYLNKAAEITLDLIKRLNCNPENTVIKICTGHINTRSKDALRREGFEVRVAEIKDPLQTMLEREFIRYLNEIGFDVTEGEPDERISFYHKAIKWVKADPLREKFAKTGWRKWD
ncbi:MAG: hypothetical protein B6U86_01330 [Candidatus Altiarchaeales archaeon ex4484_43]|nr:MAG: hypothetical protein B6U86_01330 [Candidatus Altiarchaeales archaeon ex4484_43]